MLQATAVMDPGGLLSGARPESGDDWLPSWCRPQVARPASPEARAAQAEQECTVPRRRSTDGGSEELSLGTEHEVGLVAEPDGSIHSMEAAKILSFLEPESRQWSPKYIREEDAGQSDAAFVSSSTNAETK